MFVDCETTSLRHDRRAWNIGLIRRYAATGREHSEEIIIHDVDLTEADPFALRIGHFWERHPLVSGNPGQAQIINTEAEAALCLFHLVAPQVHDGQVAPVHIVGAVPNFDVDTFTRMFARHRLMWPAHYHLIDAETLALGALAARGIQVEYPFTGEELSERLGVDMSRYARHTALGDAEWARDLYDAAMTPIVATRRE